MKFSDIKEDMKLQCVGDYADCMVAGDTYEVFHMNDENLYIRCRYGIHELSSMTYEDGEYYDDIPELEPVNV